jgi:hypothetical protein
MSGDRFSYSSAPVRRISSIQFGILDPDFIVRAYCLYPHRCVVVTTEFGPRSQFSTSEHLCDVIVFVEEVFCCKN